MWAVMWYCDPESTETDRFADVETETEADELVRALKQLGWAAVSWDQEQTYTRAHMSVLDQPVRPTLKA